MWVRKRIEITYRDLFAGLLGTFRGIDRAAASRNISDCFGGQQAVVSLSVRTAFDALLTIKAFPPGSEILFGELTIADMPRIALQHGLVPIGIPVSPTTLAMSPNELASRISPRTVAIVATQLFGGHHDLDETARLANQHSLLLMEDAAQAFAGTHYLGDPAADVSLFSFGPIKTCTALGGAVSIVRDDSLRQAMLQHLTSLPPQSNSEFTKRLLKYTGIKMLSHRLPLSVLAFAIRRLGIDYDRFASQAARSFAGASFFDRIRRQPCPALLRLLLRRLKNYRTAADQAKTNAGEELRRELSPETVLGHDSDHEKHWVFPVLVDRPDDLVTAMQTAGIDATRHSSMVALPSEPFEMPWIESHGKNSGPLAKVVFVPLEPASDPQRRRQMIRLIASGRKPVWFSPQEIRNE